MPPCVRGIPGGNSYASLCVPWVYTGYVHHGYMPPCTSLGTPPYHTQSGHATLHGWWQRGQQALERAVVELTVSGLPLTVVACYRHRCYCPSSLWD